MKKILFILVLLLAACDEQNTLHDKTEFGREFWRTCIDAKEFIVSHNSLSINLDFNGKPIPCEIKK